MIDAALGAMPRLQFGVRSVQAATDAATPSLRATLSIAAEAGVSVLGLALNVDVRIAAERRRYSDAERGRLRELFGSDGDWDRSIGPIVWTRGTINVPAFEDSVDTTVILPCGYEFDMVAVKYATALEGGFIPVEILPTGTVFYRGGERMLAGKLPWDTEIAFRIDVSTWRAAVDAVFNGTAWLRIDDRLLRRLQTYRAQHGLTTWDSTIEALLSGREP
ncbi:MAG TPA: DUF6084 family protein [Candidatus Tumulicola sp.]